MIESQEEDLDLLYQALDLQRGLIARSSAHQQIIMEHIAQALQSATDCWLAQKSRVAAREAFRPRLTRLRRRKG